jgi:hypothetical protein
MEDPSTLDQMNPVDGYQVEVQVAPGIYKRVKADCDRNDKQFIEKRTCVIPQQYLY